MIRFFKRNRVWTKKIFLRRNFYSYKSSLANRTSSNQNKWINLTTCCLIGAVSIGFGIEKNDCFIVDEKERPNTPIARYSISDAVDKAFPALVNIQVNISNGFSRGIASGSGFIFDASNRLIATNHHVIQSSIGQELTVTLSDGRQYIGKVHSYDALTDLAIVEISSPISTKKVGFWAESTESELREVKLGESSKLRLGEWVIALGSPLGMHNSVSCGIVSSINRSASELGLTQRRTDYIQTDASINQGNSGGPLINLDGEVVGINTMKVANQDGISFAVPIDVAKIVLDQLKQKRRVDRPYLGLKMMPVKTVSKGRVGKDGVVVASVAKNSPAAQGGITKGDMLLEIDDVEIKNSSDVIRIIGYELGRVHKVKVLKPNGKIKHLKVKTIAVTF